MEWKEITEAMWCWSVCMKYKYDKYTDKLHEEPRKIYNRCSDIRDLFNIARLHKAVDLSVEFTQKILTMNPVSFKGKFFSAEHMRKFETDYSVVKIEKDSAEPCRLRLLVDNL